MKYLKLASVLIMVFAMFSITSCDNEPLEGEFGDGTTDNGGNNNGGNASNCIEATNNLGDATTAFGQVTSSDPNYSTVCNNYLNALQDVLNLCGDPSGTIQIIIDSLDCSTNTPDDCASAQVATQSAADAYNANSTNSAFCNAYISALQNEIALCGDANGSLQAIIDGLDCNTSSNDLLPRQIIHTYPDGSTIVEDFTFSGNRLTRQEYTQNFPGEPSLTDIYEYTYENDLLVRIDETTTDPSGNPETSYSIFGYDSNNRMISETIYFSTNTQVDTYVHNSDGTITLTEGGEEIWIFTYDNNGNLVTSDHTNGSQFYVYTYDDKNSVGKNIYARDIVGQYQEGTGNNNLISTVDTNDSTFPENENYTYTYNSDNYPVTATFIYNQGLDSEETSTIQFFYY